MCTRPHVDHPHLTEKNTSYVVNVSNSVKALSGFKNVI